LPLYKFNGDDDEPMHFAGIEQNFWPEFTIQVLVPVLFVYSDTSRLTLVLIITLTVSRLR